MTCTLCQNSGVSEYISVPAAYWVCSSCGLVWLDQKHHLSSEKEEARYRTHNNSVDNSEYLKFLSKLANPVSKYLKSGDLGLDFGAGQAKGMAKLLPDFTVSTFDPVFHSDRKLLKNSYNFILCSEVVEHFFEPRKDFDLLDSMLVPGGILGISSSLRPAKDKFVQWYYRRDPSHVSFFEEKTVRWLADHYHWNVLELENPIWIFQKN